MGPAAQLSLPPWGILRAVRLTLLARAGQLELSRGGHASGPVLDGAREAGPVDPVDARCDGSQLSLVVPVSEPLAGLRDVLPGGRKSGSGAHSNHLTQGAPEAPEGDAEGGAGSRRGS